MKLSKLALLFVVFVDISGQGLIFPILVTVLTDPSAGFLPADTNQGTRQLYYGLTIGAFFLAWFLGSVYIARLSDSIGRKWGIQLCLAGAGAGYVLTIVALATSSLWLLVLGRAITGFTAGNQPIAQAAMSDLSTDDTDRARNMGLIVTGLSFGMMAGPIIGGVFSDGDLLGAWASLSLPFWVAIGLVALAMALVALFFHDTTTERAPLRIHPFEIFALLWSATRNQTVLRISAVFFTYMLCMLAFYVFADDVLADRFGLDTFDASLAMLIFGASMATGSTFLVAPATRMASKTAVVCGAVTVMSLAGVVFAVAPSPIMAYLAIVPFAAAQGIGYPALLTVFSKSAGEDEQGWVMGVSTALWTLGAGLISLVGGSLMTLAAWAPMALSAGAGVLTVALVAVLWRSAALRAIAGR